MNKAFLSIIVIAGFSLVGCKKDSDTKAQSIIAPAIAPVVQAPTPAPVTVPVVADSTIVTQSQKVSKELAAIKNEPPPVLPAAIEGNAGFRNASDGAAASNTQPNSAASFKPASVGNGAAAAQ